MLRGQLGMRWLGWVTLVVAVCNAVAVWIGVTFSSYHGHAWLIIGWGAYVGFLIVMLITSVSMLRRPRTSPTAAAPTTPAPRRRSSSPRARAWHFMACRGPFVRMATAARGSQPARTGGHTSPRQARKTRTLSRDYGNDPRSGELAESIGRHQRVISEHEGAMLRDIAEFDQKEAWRGDGSLSMRDWLVSGGPATGLVVRNGT